MRRADINNRRGAEDAEFYPHPKPLPTLWRGAFYLLFGEGDGVFGFGQGLDGLPLSTVEILEEVGDAFFGVDVAF